MKPSDKVKVLCMLPSLQAGGAERILVTFMNNIDRDRFAPIFVALDHGEGPVKEWINDDVEFYALNCGSVKASIFKLRNFIKEHQPDVLFTTMVHSNALAIAMKLFFPDLRVIVREAALPSSILNGYGAKGRFCYFIYKYLYPKADIVISNCSQVIDEFKNTLKIKMENHTLLFNPVDTKRIVSKKIENTENKKIINFLCVGRLSYEKGYDRLVQKIAEKFTPDFEWSLEIIGEGSFRPELEKLINTKNLNHKIKLSGHKQQPWDGISTTSVLLLPSRWEGMPNTVLEGLSCGVPCIAIRDAGGISDIGKHTKGNDLTIVDTMDAFIEAMITIASTKIHEAALPAVFSLPTVMNQFEELLIPIKN